MVFNDPKYNDKNACLKSLQTINKVIYLHLASPTQLAPVELLQGGNAAKVSGRSSVM